ncbi:LEA type 2 family protein [Pseudomonas sp.]|jgi:LEA14-like dessication related protein|uniref:LEA type 2 family protein n=1 Tax=Pseudomonas sp. TaxID=306 RepID=UPI0028A90F49|nr:LEA type 2 family protein [Pseudomonas sp.]
MFYQVHLARILALLALFTLSASQVGCSSWFRDALKDPEVRLVKVEVVKARLLEQRFLLRFRIDNPNPVSLSVRGLIYDIYLNDIPLAEGEFNQHVSVPAHGHETFEIPVTTNLWRHVKGMVKMLEEPDAPIHYRLKGEVKTGIFGHNVQVLRIGEIIPGDYLPE